MADRLYVHSPDRLARDYAHQMLLVEELQRCGVELVFFNCSTNRPKAGSCSRSSRSGRAAGPEPRSGVAAAASGHACASAGAGQRTGPRPLRISPFANATAMARLYQVVLEEAKVVQRMFAWFAFEAVRSARWRRLMAEAIPRRAVCRTGTPGTLSAMMQNPAYKGEAHFGKSRNGRRG